MIERACFLDRDGVLNLDSGYVYRQEDFHWVPGCLDALKSLAQLGFVFFITTNQSGLARGYYTQDDFDKLTAWMTQALASHGIEIKATYFCPHHPREGVVTSWVGPCACRKPAPGMMLQAQQDFNLDMRQAIMVGDKPSDMQAALAANIGVRILVGKNGQSLPEMVPEATHRYTSLLDAVRHAKEWL